MGIPPKEILRLSRGPVEAAGVGLDVQPGDILMRANFSTWARREQGFRVLDRRAGRISEGTSELAEVLREVDLGSGTTATLVPSTQHRAVVRLRGEGLSSAVSDTDPRIEFSETAVRESMPTRRGDPASRLTADLLNRFLRIAHERLQAHPLNGLRERKGLPPANGLLTRGAGTASPVVSTLSWVGLRVAVVTGERTIAGLARMLGFDLIMDEAFTALDDTDLTRKLAAALDALSSHDMVYLHVKGPDVCSADRDPQAKRRFFERIDQELVPMLGLDQVIGITGDHSSGSLVGRHTGDPVPSLICAPGGRRDDQTLFGERGCMKGGLGRITATGFMLTMLDAMDALPKFHPGDERFFL
jgi:2,3-bisphosphoglycerate-independent phosphoglycerate mutase